MELPGVILIRAAELELGELESVGVGTFWPESWSESEPESESVKLYRLRLRLTRAIESIDISLPINN